ncbi:MAG: M23 family metallopeptidase [Flavobacteriales bacterium]|nr:M23 family metallopeptidase [Flavobacteriales bacterium]
MKKIVVIIFLFFSLLSFAQSLDCPLRDGVILLNKSTDEFNINNMRIMIEAEKSGKVKSFIAGKIFNILKDEPTKTYIVIIKDGQSYVSFNGLDSVSVKKDDIIKEGEKIGSIKPFRGKYTLIIMKFINAELVTKPFENDLKCRLQTAKNLPRSAKSPDVADIDIADL